ncbi:MAG: hypothetical protein HZB19_02070 [Chloroflexi bacterium]|nr:hypothetical protein [Chloroflexota bacterium]
MRRHEARRQPVNLIQRGGKNIRIKEVDLRAKRRFHCFSEHFLSLGGGAFHHELTQAFGGSQQAHGSIKRRFIHLRSRRRDEKGK